jgi:hypothetical protein
MAVTNPSDPVEPLVMRALELARGGAADDRAVDDLVGRANGDRESVEAARDLLVQRMHRRRDDDFTRVRALRLLERATRRMPREDPKWRMRHSRWGGLWRSRG